MEKIRVAIVGCGGFQRYRVGNLLQVKEAEIVALVDPSDDQMSQMREQHPTTAGVPGFKDSKEMLEQVKPDAIMIATPHTQHVDQILEGLAAGVHVCCEKPLVTSVTDAHRVIAARDKAKKIGMVSYQRHYQAEFRYIRAKILSGEAGPVQYIQALNDQAWLRGTKGTWRQLMSLSGGGQLNDTGSHLVDILLWASTCSASKVAAFCDNKGTEVDINSALSIMFTNGAMGNLAIVGDGMGWHEDITFWCENMAFFVRDGKLTIVERNGNRLKCENLSGGGTPDRNFIMACLGKEECESPFECGLEVIRLTEAAWKSSDLGGTPVEVSSLG